MSIRQQIADCYAAYAARDIEGTMALFADNVLCGWLPGCKNFMKGGVMVGYSLVSGLLMRRT